MWVVTVTAPADLVLWLGLVLLVVTFAVGRRRLGATPGGRRLLGGLAGPAGWAGVGLLVVVLSPPVDRLATVSVAVHMGQHLALLLLAAPALVAGHAVAVLGAAAPRTVREHRRLRLGDRWTRPLLAAAVLAAVWWAWHVPALYGAALEVPVLHGVEHVTMLGAAWLFWAVLLGQRSEGGAAVAAVFLTALHMAAMAALLSFPTEPWLRALPGGPAPLLDQRVAGGLLWFPGGTTWIVLGTWLVWRWLRADELAHEPEPVEGQVPAG